MLQNFVGIDLQIYQHLLLGIIELKIHLKYTHLAQQTTKISEIGFEYLM